MTTAFALRAVKHGIEEVFQEEIAEAENGSELGGSWQEFSVDCPPTYVVAVYVWVCVFFLVYALRVENRQLDEFLQTAGLDPVTDHCNRRCRALRESVPSIFNLAATWSTRPHPVVLAASRVGMVENSEIGYIS